MLNEKSVVVNRSYFYKVSHVLVLCDSKYDPWTSSIHIIWDLVRNAGFQDLS